MKYLALMVLAAFGFVEVAYGHAHLQTSEPANASTITQLPKNIMLQFNKVAQVTMLTLQKGDAQARSLAPLPNAAATTVSVPMPAVDAGNYIITWRAVGDDGHVVSGQVSFTLAPPGKAQ